MLRRRTLFDTHILEAVAERDIDLLVLEELTVSREFAEWFFLENHLALPIQNSARAFHSVSDAELGESDIVVLYENGHAILVENKIGAIAQKNQAKRYRQRGEKGLLCKSWSSYSTCIIAPNNYLERTADARGYQTHISYEQIRDWFGSHNTERHQFKRNLMHEAIEQNRRGYTNIPDARVTAFWKDYWDFATLDYPNLGMYQPGNKPANSSFIYFHPEALPGKFQLIHKVDHGFVDLQIANMSQMLDNLIEMFSDIDIEIVKAGKSIAFRKRLQKMNIYTSFKDQECVAETALQQVDELVSIAKEIWLRISQRPTTRTVEEVH
jgi:hypothetical protein